MVGQKVECGELESSYVFVWHVQLTEKVPPAPPVLDSTRIIAAKNVSIFTKIYSMVTFLVKCTQNENL